MTFPRFPLLAFALAGIIGLTACETAQDADATAEQKPAKKTRLDDFETTGETERCVPITSIDQADVIDDQTILFVMKGNKYYVNHLPYRCPQLGFEERFSYATSLSSLCNTDIITVLTTTGRGASCGLGLFEELKKKEKTESEQ